ncbi:MAG: hypothetical protein ACP6IP_10650 [Candidatus Njordarchaeia archaeon]
METKAFLHAAVVQKVDGSVLYAAGNIGRDPALISGYISAFHSMDREFKINRGEEEKVITRFHFIGDVLLIITGDEEVTLYTIFNEVIPDLIDELQDFNKKLFYKFAKIVWRKSSDEDKDLGILPFDLLSKFEKEFFELCISIPWSNLIRFSQYFLHSDSGFNLVIYLLNKVGRKIINTLGVNAFWLLIEGVLKEDKLDPMLKKAIKIKNMGDANPLIEAVKPKKLSEIDFVFIISRILNLVHYRIKRALGEKVLGELNVLSGVSNVPRITTV